MTVTRRVELYAAQGNEAPREVERIAGGPQWSGWEWEEE